MKKRIGSGWGIRYQLADKRSRKKIFKNGQLEFY